MTEWRWEVVEGRCEADGADGVTVYGVRARQADRVEWTFEDVDTDRRRAEQLAARLQDAQPEPCHWQELAEDWVAAAVTPISCGMQ